MTQQQLLAFLREELAEEGLISIRFCQQDGLLLRTRCKLPCMTVTDGCEPFAHEAEVLLRQDDCGWHARLEHPGPGRVLHPNWDAGGCWHSEQLSRCANASPEELRDLLRSIIRSLNMKRDAYSLTHAVNRNAAAWCYDNGKDNRCIVLEDREGMHPPRPEERDRRRIRIEPDAL